MLKPSLPYLPYHEGLDTEETPVQTAEKHKLDYLKFYSCSMYYSYIHNNKVFCVGGSKGQSVLYLP